MLHLHSFRARRLSKGLRFAAVLVAASVAACAHNPPPRPELGTPQANVLVTVTNQNVNDVDVFISLSGVRQRLGTVVSQGTGNFEVPWDRIGAAGQSQLIVSPIGSNGAYRTGSLALQPGSQVGVTVAPVLRNSTTRVY
jgi:hypothetical protein